jgi:hypothetical protein
MARGCHGLPKVLPWPAMPYPSTPCRAGGLQPSSTPLDTPRRTPIVKKKKVIDAFMHESRLTNGNGIGVAHKLYYLFAEF